MNKTFGLELLLTLKQIFTDYALLYNILLYMVCVLLLFWGCLLLFRYSKLYSMAIKFLLFTILSVVICRVSLVHVREQVNEHLLSLTNDEKDILMYIYNRSNKIANAVYIPYDNAIAINLKYKRILRQYDTTPIRIVRLKGTPDSKYCFLYGIRQMPKDFIKDDKIKNTNFPSTKLCNYLDKYQ